MKGDIGMANYEKQVEQEAAYPIPISLYNCYRTVRHEKRYQEFIACCYGVARFIVQNKQATTLWSGSRDLYRV